MYSKKISPSLLSANFASLGQEVTALEAAGADWLHLDVMDGQFVDNLTFGAGVVKALRPLTKLPLDVHLMILQPERRLADFAQAGADIITIHAETGHHLHRNLTAIRALKCQAGLALNPATPLSVLQYLLPFVDMVLVMSVNPGFGGQSFIPHMLTKISALRQMITDSGYEVQIQVDGGITIDNVSDVLQAGADIIVAGTSVFKDGQEQYAKNIKALRTGGT